MKDPDYNPYARKPQKEIEEDEGILEVEYEDPEQEIKKRLKQGTKNQKMIKATLNTIRVKR